MKYFLVDNNSISETKKSMKKTKWWTFLLSNIVVFLILGFLDNYVVYTFVKNVIAANYEGGAELFKQQLSDGTLPGNYEASIMIVMMFAYLIIILGLYLFNRFYYKRNNASFGLMNKGNLKAYIKGVLLGGISFTFIVFIVMLIGNLKLSGPNNIDILIFVGLLIGWIIQGFFEEWVFRAIFMNGLAVKGNIILIIILNSLVFALMHGANPNLTILALINLFILGLVFSLVFYLFDNILVPAAFHSFWNFFQGNFYGIEVSGTKTAEAYSIFQSEISATNDLITGGKFGIEGSIVCTIVITIMLIACIYKIYKKGLITKKIID